MPYTPTPDEARRVGRAIELASFSEGERIFWLTAFVSIAVLDVYMIVSGMTWAAAVGSVGSLLPLYWRLRGGHLAGKVAGDRGLFGLNLATREQRAFTALMLRQVITGRNALAARVEHDPFKDWGKPLERAEAVDLSED